MVKKKISNIINQLHSPIDFLPQENSQERLVALMMEGVPSFIKGEVEMHLSRLYNNLINVNLEETKVVVFGGGTGLANLIGGGSRRSNWKDSPFEGLKEIFPNTKSVVCVTDDGGSTGELLKDLPLIALGDIRHVLLSSVQKGKLKNKYNLNIKQAISVAGLLAELFNSRLKVKSNGTALKISEIVTIAGLPDELQNYLKNLYNYLLADRRLKDVVQREHCIGNLLIVAAIYRSLGRQFTFDSEDEVDTLHKSIESGLKELSFMLGVKEFGVMPCTSTPAQLRVLYTNGVEVIGESKMSHSRRDYPVEHVSVDFCRKPAIYSSVVDSIKAADLIVFAPGSLYSSIIPILKLKELVDAVRDNQHAQKLLVSNLWVQSGETDLSILDPNRKFLVSDMIKAYEQNIPGGTVGLFQKILCLRLNDIPASVLQEYAVEGKVPIYLDRLRVEEMGYTPVECGVYSKEALKEEGVIQHDANMLASAIRALFCGGDYLDFCENEKVQQRQKRIAPHFVGGTCLLPATRYNLLIDHFEQLDIQCDFKQIINPVLIDLLWKNRDIPLSHLNFFKGIQCIDIKDWKRSQKWDNVFSCYDPEDGYIKIRSDLVEDESQFSVGFLIALGQTLLGDYALEKKISPIHSKGIRLGRVYHLFLKDSKERSCYFSESELDHWLQLTRMNPIEDIPNQYTRLLNKDEGFTPPGLFLGLVYAWYIDNRLASHIEYKMSVLKITETNLVPEQKKMSNRRQLMIQFMRKIVFDQNRKY